MPHRLLWVAVLLAASTALANGACVQPKRGWFDKPTSYRNGMAWSAYWECLHGIEKRRPAR